MAPPPGLWSVTMYDATSGYTIPNPIDRYALGGADNLEKNPDGSFALYIQHDDPGPNKESNWLPAPEERFTSFSATMHLLRLSMRAQVAINIRVGPPTIVPRP
jgi:hypothetical protein